jgi:protocatechuate 3,4-dioxygenase beta subunit
MINFVLWIIVVAAALQLPPLPPPPPPPPPPLPLAQTQPQQDPASIEGIVVDGSTNMPLANVSLSRNGALISLGSVADLVLLDLINNTSGSVITDSEGHFSIEGINPGSVTIFARKPGYMDLRPEGHRITGNSTGVIFALTPRQRLQGVVLRMFPAAIVTGRVVDLRGQPVASVNVTAFRQGYDDMGELVPKNVTSVQTDDRGEFRFSTLGPGAYSFLFEKNFIRFVQGNPASYYAVYYPGARDLRSAAVLSIDGGAETRLNNLILPSGRGGILTIHVTREASAGPTTQVVIWRPGDPTDTTNGNFPDPSEGIAGQLPPGTYQIEIDTGKSRGYARVELGEEDLRINVNVPNPATIVGRAGIGAPHDDAQFKPVQNARLSLIDTIANNSANRPTLVSAADGRFTNPSVKPGLFYVSSFALPPNMYLLAVREGDRDVFGEKFPIDGGNIDLNLIVGEGPGTVRGTVIDGRGNKVAGAAVALMPDDRTQKALMLSKNTDGNGVFEIQAAPGSYHLYSWTEMDGAAYRNQEFMKKYDDRGKPVRIEKNGKVTADLNPVDEITGH